MIALGSLNAAEDAEALIKSKIGEFLQAETKLRTLRAHPSISIQSKAAGLLVKHQQIEKDLADAKAASDRIQSKAYILDDIYLIGRTSVALMMHLSEVNMLDKEAGGFVSQRLSEPYTFTMVIGIGVIVLFILGGLFSRH